MIGVLRPDARYAVPTSRRNASGSVESLVDTDHPIIKASHFDFGTHWGVNAPQLGGNLTWDSRGGVMYPELSGYLYLTKKVVLTERTRLTFSSEFFNIFNHVNFLDPGVSGYAGGGVSLQSPQTFGVITTQGNDPRQIQLGLRFDF